MQTQTPVTVVPKKREYVQPVLTKFGSVARLSQAGNGSLIEGMHSMNVKRKP